LLKLWFLAAENKCDDLHYVVKTDVMLSPGTTSIGIISVGRGRIPFHEPTIWGRAQGQDREKVGSSTTVPEKYLNIKTEYINTQQGLPGIGYTLARN
jgi:hypothetical protein